MHERIRVIRENPLNPCLVCAFGLRAFAVGICRVFTEFSRFLWCFARFFVGDGFIRPEITSLYVNRRYPSRDYLTLR
ncbi:MAG: hypothetical protein FWG87_12745 [Defluviitaleaceae bacterium]|nr:hypothetical protein [Defluviitaleaceae bacterium]